MTSFTFEPEPRPFPRWLGPFSPARGTRSGFRFAYGRLGTWVELPQHREFWVLVDSPGVRGLEALVLNEWRGGRVLLLPNGFVVKPLQGDHEVGRRALIGRFRGPVVLERPDGSLFDLADPGQLDAGDNWAGPKTTGLECTTQADGSLEATWYHPSEFGREVVQEQLFGPTADIATGFRKARPGVLGGRVRVTANGQVITNREEPNGTWQARYVGRVGLPQWSRRSEWIARKTR